MISAPDCALFSLFSPSSYIARMEAVPADSVPAPYHQLLVHPHHMTVTVEAHYGELVDVRLLEKIQEGDTYARKILLVTQKTRHVVQFGLVRIHLQYCSATVGAEIVAGLTPLGRILIEHDVLRRIEPMLYLRVLPGPAMMEWFALTQREWTFGRQALIHCDGKPAIELLEILAPTGEACGGR
jgi:chorismate-pyruvate lyase